MRITVLVAAVVVALCCSATSFAYTVNIGDNLGFETGSYIQEMFPANFPYPWHGDTGVFIGTDQGVTPYEGQRMFKFQYSNIYPSPDINGSCEVSINFDLTPYQSAIAAGLAKIDVSAYFNTIPGSFVDNRYNIRLYVSSTKGSTGSATRIDGNYLLTDFNTSTWERLDAFNGFVIPADTNYMRVIVLALQNRYLDHQFPEFLGNYVDDVSITLTAPEPSSAGVLLLGCSLLIKAGFSSKRAGNRSARRR